MLYEVITAEGERARAQAFVDLMIPIVKGWSTENSIDISSMGVQVHGGSYNFV